MGLVSSSFDRFQVDAVEAITNDFKENAKGRYLLVVPTGGGKTMTAVRSVHGLIRNGTIASSGKPIAWVAHRRELLRQAKATFDKYARIYGEESRADTVDFLMIQKARESFDSGRAYPFVVIDEAHHGAAASYQPLFGSSKTGILGLTATPSRYDGKPLEFERESYSIGFPDLIELGVLIRPEIRQVQGVRAADSDIAGTFDGLTNDDRYSIIRDAILADVGSYTKIIIYINSQKAAEELQQFLVRSEVEKHYESISYIHGSRNSRNVTPDQFFKQEKAFERSIVVNIDILSEGYDDPKVNTVVMARPTNSKLVYMQAVGRGVRLDEENPDKRSYVVEIIDELPNIGYRIDNRWLFSELSDALEPAVVDYSFATENEYIELLDRLALDYGLPLDWNVPDYDPRNRRSLLLFRYMAHTGQFQHQPIWLDQKSRHQVAELFNFLSERMATYAHRASPEAVIAMRPHDRVTELEQTSIRQRVFNAMENQFAVISKQAENWERAGYPYLTYVALQWRRQVELLPVDMLEFIADMINREAIVHRLQNGSFVEGDVLVRLPLPLRGYEGRIVSQDQFAQIDEIVGKLTSAKNETVSSRDQTDSANSILGESVWPLESELLASTLTVARYDIEYFKEL